MKPQLPPGLCESLDLRPIGSLGGRLNHHCLVEKGADRLVLRRWSPQPPGSIQFERRLISSLAEKSWPVAPLDEPFEFDGRLWSLAPFLAGETPVHGGAEEQRSRGRLLAKLHEDTASLGDLGQRPGWRRCEEILADSELDTTLAQHEKLLPEEVRIVRWHLDRARGRIEGLRLESRAGIPVHGDFTPWNLRFEGGHLTGLLDFELARCDHRVADFSLSWRGKYDAVIEGYEEVSRLDPIERAAIVPVWWSELIEGACQHLQAGRGIDKWTIDKLLVRSPIMGPDAVEIP